jgi:hypothetical protein
VDFSTTTLRDAGKKNSVVFINNLKRDLGALEKDKRD